MTFVNGGWSVKHLNIQLTLDRTINYYIFMMNFPIIYFRLLGRPKGVILSHENIVAATSACIVQLGKKIRTFQSGGRVSEPKCHNFLPNFQLFPNRFFKANRPLIFTNNVLYLKTKYTYFTSFLALFWSILVSYLRISWDFQWNPL